MEIRIGTSGWQYRHWKKSVYPEKLRQADWLAHYATLFDSVEVNASFYKLPETSDIRRWCDSTPDGFRFAVKAPRGISHFKKLKNCGPQLSALIQRLEAFGPRLGPVLFQLPPRWHSNPRRLEDFLAMLPSGHRYAFEFRDPSWHCKENYALLAEHGAAFCIFDLDGHTSPLKTPADFVYVRLHGPRSAYSGNYRAEALRTWAGRAQGWLRKKKSVYVYFDNDARAYSAKNARRMLAMMRPQEEIPAAIVAG